jgi:hypothetical protein
MSNEVLGDDIVKDLEDDVVELIDYNRRRR